jgi:hypothetical protein
MFFLHLDSMNNLLNYEKFSVQGYVRIVNCQSNSTGTYQGLVLFNKAIETNSGLIKQNKNWGLAYFEYKDSLTFHLIDSADNFDIIDFKAGKETSRILFKKSDKPDIIIRVFSNGSVKTHNLTNIYSAQNKSDFLTCGIIDSNSIFYIERTNKLQLTILNRFQSSWKSYSLDITGYRFINSILFDTTVDVYLQKEDSIFILTFNNNRTPSVGDIKFMFTGDVINLNSIYCGTSKYYYGTTRSFVTTSSDTLSFDSSGNSFIIVDFEDDEQLDTSIFIKYNNIFEIVITGEQTTLYFDELIISESNSNFISIENSDGIGFKYKSFAFPKKKTNDEINIMNGAFQFVYPNPYAPSEASLRVRIPSKHGEIADIRIFSSSGQLVYSKSIVILNGIVNIELYENGFNPGCYILKTQTSKSTYTNKLIIK